VHPSLRVHHRFAAVGQSVRCKPFPKGGTEEWPRKDVPYCSDDGELMAMCYENRKAVFTESGVEAPLRVLGLDPRPCISVCSGRSCRRRARGLI